MLDLAEGAATAALENAGLTGADIDVVILSTVTYFHQTPAGAAIIADRIGATPAAAFDISAACAGLLLRHRPGRRAGPCRHRPQRAGDRRREDERAVDPTDRSISFLLGDGAGAVVIGPSDTPGIGPTIWGSDGSQAQAIRQTHSWLATRDEGLGWPTLRQEGQSVYKWAVWQMAPVAQKALDAAGVTADEIEAFIPHQANMRIIDQMIKTLKLPATVVVGRDIAETGNTSAASIPLATERLLREGQVSSGALALQIGFGAGLVYAAQVVVLP